MTTKKKLYRVHGSIWVMREMTFDKDFELREALRSKFREFGQANPDQSLLDWIWTSGILERTMQVLLTRYEPTVIHRWWNELAIWRSGIDPTRIIGKMTHQQILGVLADFFHLNAAWMSDLQRFGGGLGSTPTTDGEATPSTSGPEPPRNAPSSSPGGTSNARPGL